MFFVILKKKKKDKISSFLNTIREDKSSEEECFKELYTGFLCRPSIRNQICCGLFWDPYQLLPPCSLQQYPYVLRHFTVKHIHRNSFPKQHFILMTSTAVFQWVFLSQRASSEPSESFCSLLGKSWPMNRGQTRLFPS